MPRVTLVRRVRFASWRDWLLDRLILWGMALVLSVAVSNLLAPAF